MSYASVVLADSPLGYWRLGESAFASPAVDQTGNQNGVYTFTAGLTFGNPGIPGGGGSTSARFVAAQLGRVLITDNASQHVANTFSLECWFKRSSTGAYAGLMGSNDDGSANSSRAGIVIDPTNVIGLFRSNQGFVASTSGTQTDTANWHHAVVTKSGAASKVYIDGADVTVAGTDFTFPTNFGWMIGVETTGANFDGYLAEAAVYATVLSAAAVRTHYAVGANPPPDARTAMSMLGTGTGRL